MDMAGADFPVFLPIIGLNPLILDGGVGVG